jgi:hypothetical protein
MALINKVEKSQTRAKSYTLDLRIHSPASLGYLGIQGLDTAPALVRLAKVKGLDVIALTDYHSGAYIDRISAAAKNSQVTVIPGVDLRCNIGGCDDITLTVLFDEGFTSAQVDEFLREIDVPEAASGNKEYIIQTPIEKILTLIEYYQGAVFPSRIDKTPYRLRAIPTLVEQYGFRSFDVAYHESVDFFKKHWPKYKFNIFSFSDANALAQVGSRTANVKLASPTFSSIKELVQRV